MDLGRVKHAAKQRIIERLGPLDDPPEMPDARTLQPVLPLPDGWTRDRLLARLSSLSIDGAPSSELEGYVRGDFERFVHTLDLVPADAGGPALEIGANPYFTTMLLRWFRPGLDLELVNYFGAEFTGDLQRISFDGTDGHTEAIDLPFAHCNVETTRLPYDDDQFEVVLFCEVLEHLTHDPLVAMLELKRVLRPGGTLVLTTPNACRLDNVVAMAEGRNVYDPYSGYGPYGRHNREYTHHEVHELLTFCGFTPTTFHTVDVHPDPPPSPAVRKGVAHALQSIPGRLGDLGQYLVSASQNTGSAEPGRPDWLFRSYTPDAMATTPVHQG